MKKHNVLIYPYNYNVAPFIRYREILSDFDIVGADTLPGLLLSGRDAAFADEGMPTGITVTTSFHESCEKADTLIWAECSSALRKSGFKTIIKNILYALDCGKEIVCLDDIDPSVIAFLKSYAEETPGEFIHYKDLCYQSCDTGFTSIELKVPVIMVGSIHEGNSKFELQMMLYKNLQKAGLKILYIGSKPYSEVFGFHSIPDFMFQAERTEGEKIRGFKNYIRHLIDQENPDVILIGIPGGILPCHDKVDYNFGMLYYEILQVVIPDFMIMMLPGDNYQDNALRNLTESVKGRLPIPVDVFGISNFRFDYETVEFSYATINYDILGMDKMKKIKERYCRILPEENICVSTIESEQQLCLKWLIDKLGV